MLRGPVVADIFTHPDRWTQVTEYHQSKTSGLTLTPVHASAHPVPKHFTNVHNIQHAHNTHTTRTQHAHKMQHAYTHAIAL